MRYSPVGTGCGYPLLGLDGGAPLSPSPSGLDGGTPCWDWMGVVPTCQDWMGVQPPPPPKPIRTSGDRAVTCSAVCLLHWRRMTFLLHLKVHSVLNFNSNKMIKIHVFCYSKYWYAFQDIKTLFQMVFEAFTVLLCFLSVALGLTPGEELRKLLFDTNEYDPDASPEVETGKTAVEISLEFSLQSLHSLVSEAFVIADNFSVFLKSFILNWTSLFTA